MMRNGTFNEKELKIIIASNQVRCMCTYVRMVNEIFIYRNCAVAKKEEFNCLLYMKGRIVDYFTKVINSVQRLHTYQ